MENQEEERVPKAHVLNRIHVLTESCGRSECKVKHVTELRIGTDVT